MPTLMKPLLTLSDLVEMFDVTRVTIWQWVQRGHLPEPIRVGGRKPYWTSEQIESLLEARHGARRKAR
jgi:predicted DNA-binding transcriptional regulator AlpA